MSPDKTLEKIRHSASHLLASAVKELYPNARLGIGPAIADGFYYDFDFSNEVRKESAAPFGEQKIGDEDLPKIEEKMHEIQGRGEKFDREEISVDQAQKLFKDQPYKLELVNEIKSEALTKKEPRSVSTYQHGNFTDLCRGPHVKSTKDIGPFKLLSVAGAYWRGNEKNKMLTRIYGTAFATQRELDEYLKLQEDARKRDHRKIGKDLDLFIFDDEVGPGLPIWKPKGAVLRNLVMDFAFNTYLMRGYEPVTSPHIASVALWKRSGHWEFYKEGMYSPFGLDETQYSLKPMNCPFHVKIYNSKIRSYRDLPIRYTEMGTVYRYEKSGVLHGLTRVRGFTQDDAHIICRRDQLHQEIVEAIDLTKYILNTFGFEELNFRLSVRDPSNLQKYLGDSKDWDFAEKSLEDALREKGYKNIPRDEGEAVFYAPKIDLKVADSLGREWQLSTIQIDFNLPLKFNMIYIDENGQEKQPFMLHRALLGSIERFLGILIEHYDGDFPVWLSPVQAVVIPITDRHLDYAQGALNSLKSQSLRVELDSRNETMQKKIRGAQLQKIPYMLIVGDREVEDNKISVRLRTGQSLGQMSTKEFKDLLHKHTLTKSLKL